MRQGKFSFNPTTSPMRDTYGEHWGNGIRCRKSARGSVRGVPSNGRPYCDPEFKRKWYNMLFVVLS